MKKQQTMIILIVAIMFLSIVGSTILYIVALSKEDGGSSTSSQTAQDSQTPTEEAKPLDPPEVFIPKSDVTKLETKDLKVGSGTVVTADSTLTVHYHGTLAKDGTVFDSSYERGQTATFPLSGVIKGWQEGLLGMKAGGTRRLVIPSDLAYGEAGSPPKIGPNADLVFVVELKSVQ